MAFVIDATRRTPAALQGMALPLSARASSVASEHRTNPVLICWHASAALASDRFGIPHSGMIASHP